MMKETKKDSNSEPRIEDIILNHSKRGMDILRKHLPDDFVAVVSKKLMHLKKNNIFITTGFFVEGYAETDGPLGTYFLSKALRNIGFKPIIITDTYCNGFFEDASDADVVYIPLMIPDCNVFFDDLINTHKPTCMISIERCGRNIQGKYCNMRGVDITEHTSPIDRLFDMFAEKDIYTIGIGDGGNEIGMGNLHNVISEELDISSAISRVDDLIIATVSNWGAYALIAYLQEITALNLLPKYNEVKEYIDKIVKIGCVDGVTKLRTSTVDGFDLSYDENILEEIHLALRRNKSNSFRMSSDYAQKSISQFSIGKKVVELLNGQFIENHTDYLKVLDIGCGPGNLTNALNLALKQKSKKNELTAVDFDEHAINKAKSLYNDINFQQANMYELPEEFNEQFDYIFSNETLHWMPEYCFARHLKNNIIYYFLDEDEQKNYQKFAIKSYEKSFSNIHNALKKNGKAILQFGLHGQLFKIYDILNSVFKERIEYLSNEYFLPIYYPTRQELIDICSKEKFDIISLDIISRPLSETKTQEIIDFLKGFMQNSLIESINASNTVLFFEEIGKVIDKKNINEFRKDQWKHVVIVLEKQKV